MCTGRHEKLTRFLLQQAVIGFCFVALLLADNPATANTETKLELAVVYVGHDEEPLIPLSLLDEPAEGEGLMGVELGLNDNQTTGSFLGHNYTLESVLLPEGESLSENLSSKIAADSALVIADLRAESLLELADAYPNALIFNIRALDDRLRNADCRSNVLHVAPSRSMLADGLIQYLVWKRWDEIVLVTGRHEVDSLYADALKRAVQRFGVKIVEEKPWTAVPGARRSDSGHHSLQQQVPTFSRFKDHDVLMVADELDEFGEYLSYRTSEPRPVAGTQGLMGSAWHRSQEQWGATQIQRRFIKLAERFMTARDYAGWAAMRSIGESVTQTSSASSAELRDFLLSDNFNLAAFKGVPLTYRGWNGQLRQPVLVVGPRMLVSVSPQDGFLHQVSVLDTLGYDEPETGCEAFN
ncbi:MAG: ABC transporter substrate-binding protein [Granulosicoccus sp.]|nr:ABC transporter substrate-binding protein [Granulosicoccus sp.]